MVVTELGIVMLVSPMQPLKAWLPMVVTELGITVFWQPIIKVLFAVSIMALLLLRESYVELSFATVMLVNLVKPDTKLAGILFTLFPMLIVDIFEL